MVLLRKKTHILNSGVGALIFAVKTHPGSGSDRIIASKRQVTALATLYIGRSVTNTGCINM